LPANIQDRDGDKPLRAAFFRQKTRRRVKPIWADGGYAGSLLEQACKGWRCTVEIVKRSEFHPFKGLPQRWVVERTFGWLVVIADLVATTNGKPPLAKRWSASP